LKQLSSERYKITYATARMPTLCMYLKFLIAKLAEDWSEHYN